MSTLRRILKYTPAVLLGLLIVAWVVSWFGAIRVRPNLKGAVLVAAVASSSVNVKLSNLAADASPDLRPVQMFGFPNKPFQILGTASFESLDYLGIRRWQLLIPLPMVITAMAPVALGPFLSYRFRLWHYLAYTSLIALELDYYLWWQS